MRTKNLWLLAVLAALSPDLKADPNADVAAALKGLSEKPSYHWTTVTKADGPAAPGPVEGRTEKDGFTSVKLASRNSTTEFFAQGTNILVKSEGVWQSLEQALAAEAPGGGGQAFRSVRDFKMPLPQAKELAGAVKEFKADGDAIIGELSEDAARRLLTPRAGRGAGTPPPNAQGSVKFRIEHGAVAKFTVTLVGSLDINGQERRLDRIITTTFDAFGAAQAEMPDDAKKALADLGNGILPPPPDPRKSVTLLNGFRYDILVQGNLPEPLDLEFCPDGRLWTTGRRGQVWAYDFKTQANTLIAELPVGWQVPANRETNERGLHGIEFDPDYLKNGYVYLHYSPVPKENGLYTNRLSRFTVDTPALAKGFIAGSEKIYLEYPSPKGFHQGGSIEFNPKDGKLYVSAGDNNVSSNTREFWNDPKNAPQQLDNFRGKILRLNLDGTVPSDNPFAGKPGARGEIYTYGHRNPYSMNIDDQTGRVYVGEVGYDTPTSWEEVNRLQAGGNYGWPRLHGPNKPVFPTEEPNPIPDAIEPFISYIHDNGANATSGPLYRPSKTPFAFPEAFQNGMFYADFTRKWIRFAEMDAAGEAVMKTIPFARGFGGGPLSMQQGPDGGLYFVEYGGWFTGSPKDKLARIVYVGEKETSSAKASR